MNDLSIRLPVELWDKIVEKLSSINIKNVAKSRLLSRNFNEIVSENKASNFRAILKYQKIYFDPFGWACSKAYIRSSLSSKIYHAVEIVRWIYRKFKLTARDIRRDNFRILDFVCGDALVDCSAEGLDPNLAKIELMEWLVNSFNLTVGNSRAYSVRLIRMACDGGYFKLMRWIIETFDLGWLRLDVKRDENYIFRRTCAGGDLEIARWLADRFLTSDDIKSCHNWAFKEACSNAYSESIYYPEKGYQHLYNSKTAICETSSVKKVSGESRLEMAKWMAKTFNLTRKDVKGWSNYIFNGACGSKYNGKKVLPGFLSGLDVAMWIADTFQIKSKTIKKQYIKPLNLACRMGNFKVIKWLVERFNLTAKDIENDGNFCLDIACCNGDPDGSEKLNEIKIAKWLVNRFGSSSFNIKRVNRAFYYSCGNENLEILRWLAKEFNLTSENIRSNDNAALQRACLCGKLEVVKWLVKRFKLTVIDVMCNNNVIIKNICGRCYNIKLKNNRKKVAEWLMTKFKIKASLFSRE